MSVFRNVMAFALAPLAVQAWATTNDDAFFDYINDVICDNPQGNLVITCNAAVTTVGGSGGTLPQTGNTGTQGANDQEARTRAKMAAGPGEDEAGERVATTFGPWGVFGSVDYLALERDETERENGFENQRLTFSAGADVQLQRELLLGAVFSYSQAKTDYDFNTGDIDVDRVDAVLFASYNPVEAFLLSAYAGSGTQQNDAVRRVEFGLIRYDATAEFDSESTQWGLGASYGVAVSSLLFEAHVALDSNKAEVDGYEERGGNGPENLNFSYEAQTIESRTTTLGLTGSMNQSIRYGVLVSYLRCDLVREHETDARSVETHLVEALDEPAFFIETDEPDEQFGRVGAGMQLLRAGGVQFFVDLERLVSHEYMDSLKVTSGFRLEI